MQDSGAATRGWGWAGWGVVFALLPPPSPIPPCSRLTPREWGPWDSPTQTSSHMEWLPCHLELYPCLRVEGLSLGGTPADQEEGAVRVPEWNILDLLYCLLTRHSSRPKFSTSRISSSFHQTSCLEVKPDSWRPRWPCCRPCCSFRVQALLTCPSHSPVGSEGSPQGTEKEHDAYRHLPAGLSLHGRREVTWTWTWARAEPGAAQSPVLPTGP